MTDQGTRRTRRRDGWVVVALSAVVAGILLYLLLVPASGIDRDPPECYSTFGYVVPCGAGLSLGFALAAAVIAGAVAHMLMRRRRV